MLLQDPPEVSRAPRSQYSLSILHSYWALVLGSVKEADVSILTYWGETQQDGNEDRPPQGWEQGHQWGGALLFT